MTRRAVQFTDHEWFPLGELVGTLIGNTGDPSQSSREEDAEELDKTIVAFEAALVALRECRESIA